MSQQVLIAQCSDCENKYAETSKDKNDPYGDDNSSFGLVLEWKNKNEILKEIAKTKCPKCGSENWYLTDISEH